MEQFTSSGSRRFGMPNSNIWNGWILMKTDLAFPFPVLNISRKGNVDWIILVIHSFSWETFFRNYHLVSDWSDLWGRRRLLTMWPGRWSVSGCMSMSLRRAGVITTRGWFVLMRIEEIVEPGVMCVVEIFQGDYLGVRFNVTGGNGKYECIWSANLKCNLIFVDLVFEVPKWRLFHNVFVELELALFILWFLFVFNAAVGLSIKCELPRV